MRFTTFEMRCIAAFCCSLECICCADAPRQLLVARRSHPPAKDVPNYSRNSERRRRIEGAGPRLLGGGAAAFCLLPTQSEASKALKDTLAWRSGAGSEIVAAAGAAYKEAFATGKWNNAPVRDGAPHAKTINQYITDKNILTMSTAEGDLVYVIRASLIDDTKMMRQVSVAQLTEFLLYVKEIHALVADARSARTGRLCTVVFANDISGISQIPDRNPAPHSHQDSTRSSTRRWPEQQ